METQQEISFALRFMTEHPKAAVRVLEQTDPLAVSRLLASIPPAYSSSVLRYMMPELASSLLQRLDIDAAGAIMSDLDITIVTTILRLVAPDKRRLLLDELPAALHKNCELLLSFPINTVGAWMNPSILSIADDLKCKNVLRSLKAREATGGSDMIYIVDREGTYVGRTLLLDVLKAGENQPVSAIMDTSCPSLPAPMILAQASEHRAWEIADDLPVTNRSNKLLGILHHHTLRQGLNHHKAKRQPHQAGHDPVSSIFEVYGQSLLALLNSVSEAVESDRK